MPSCRCIADRTLNTQVEKKKAEPVGMDNEKKREKSQKMVSRLEKDLGDAAKEIQTLSTPSKMLVAVLVMAMMFGVNRT